MTNKELAVVVSAFLMNYTEMRNGVKNTIDKFYLSKNVICFCFKKFNEIILFFLGVEFGESGVNDVKHNGFCFTGK